MQSVVIPRSQSSESLLGGNMSSALAGIRMRKCEWEGENGSSKCCLLKVWARFGLWGRVILCLEACWNFLHPCGRGRATFLLDKMGSPLRTHSRILAS